VLNKLAEAWPDARCGLEFESPFQLLVATILSAQCTDKRVNTITPALFARYPDLAAVARAELSEFQEAIKSINYYLTKAKTIIACCRAILDEHCGEIPSSIDELIKLPGIGRKSANVILTEAFGIPGITVDTHLGRLSRRLGFTSQTNPVKVESELMKLLPKKHWIDFNHRIITHGRLICHARNPDCDNCPLRDLCPRLGFEDERLSEV
jgi:endonuclease-3